MPISVAKSRRRVCLLESVAVETLERRMLLSVSASTLIGSVVIDTTAGVTTSAGTSGEGSPTIEYFSPTGTTGTGALTPLVVKTSLPAAAVAGGKSHGTATVSLTNTGSAAIRESVTTEVFASLDGAIDSSSVLLGSISKVVSAKAGATAVVVVTIKSLPASLNGDYTLLAKATNTAGSSSSTTGPTVDVTAAFVAFSPETITTNLGSSLVSGSKTKADATITVTNSGNVESTGTTTVDLFVSPDGTVASGTAIREVTNSIVIEPGKNKTVKVPLENLPNVANGNYEIVAELTDPTGNVTTVATASTIELAQAFLVLTPSLSAITPGSKGTGTVSLTITDNGNIPETGVGTVALYASATGSIDGSTLLGSKSGSLPLKVGQSKTIKTKLTAAEMEEINADGLLLAAVTDPLGNVLTTSTPAAG